MRQFIGYLILAAVLFSTVPSSALGTTLSFSNSTTISGVSTPGSYHRNFGHLDLPQFALVGETLDSVTLTITPSILAFASVSFSASSSR